MTRRDQRVVSRTHTRGPDLYAYFASPERKADAAVGILHGYGEYAGRYAHVMELWAGRGIASVAIDLRGHGRSGGRRGHCERFDEYLDDTLELEHLVAEIGAPALLFGHSFGGLVAATSAIARPAPWRALVLSSPFFALSMPVSRIKLVAGEIASRIAPALPLPSGIRSTDVTHDVELARAYDQDPLVFHSATARWFTETTAAQARALRRASSIVLPLYVFMGTADRIAKAETAHEFYERAGSADKTWDPRTGLYHEVLSEPDWREMADKLAHWIVAHA